MTRTASVSLMLGLALTTTAAASPAMTYQARVLDALGTPVSGPTDVTVELFDAESGGTELWGRLFEDALVADGYVSLELERDDENDPIDPAWFSDEVWAKVTVEGAPLTTQRIRTQPGWFATGSGIATDLTWTIAPSGGDYTLLSEAMAALQNVRIQPGGSVTLTIADGTYTEADTVFLDHIDGDRITITGNDAAPANVTLVFAGDTYAVRLRNGFTLGALTGVTVSGDSTASHTGIYVEGLLRELDVAASGFVGAGVHVTGRGTVEGGSVDITGVPAAGEENAGLLVSRGGYAVLPDSTITQVGGDGVRAYDGAGVDLTGSTVSNTGVEGVRILTNSWGQFQNGFVSDTGRAGLYVGGASSLNATGVTVTNPVQNCAVAYEGAALYIGESTLTGCGSDGVLSGFAAFAWVGGTTITNAGSRGLEATFGAVLRATDTTTVTNAGVHGAQAAYNATVLLSGATLTGSGTAATNPAIDTLSGSGSYVRH